MKNLFLACFCLLLLGCNPPKEENSIIKVACIGDSITYGADIEDREINSYPAQLGTMLGEGWEVKNYGVNGRTMLKKGDYPIWNEKEYKAALDFEPNIVIIKLGTNDTKPQNWKHREEFHNDYVAMIEEFTQLKSKPTIYICLPVPAYGETWGIHPDKVKILLPIIRNIQIDTGVKLIDLYEPLLNHPEYFPDNIHPNTAGAKLMASVVKEQLNTH